MPEDKGCVRTKQLDFYHSISSKQARQRANKKLVLQGPQIRLNAAEERVLEKKGA